MSLLTLSLDFSLLKVLLDRFFGINTPRINDSIDHNPESVIVLVCISLIKSRFGRINNLKLKSKMKTKDTT
ncbi:hypothetical protein Avbf_07075 [Armadillidium vulgare]|nr:hypothetical protein Avbf_07075 [Armadillidium vulgare]